MALQTTPFPPDQKAAEDGHRRKQNDLDIEQNALLERVGSKRSNGRVFRGERNQVAFLRQPPHRALKEIAIADEIDKSVAGERGIADEHHGGARLAFFGR